MFAPFALLIALTVCRVALGRAGMHEMDWLHNFSPLAAVALCGAVYLPKRAAIWLPMAVLLLSDIALNIAYQRPFFTVEILPRYAVLGVIVAMGFALRGKVRLPGLVIASVAGSLLFYVLTNAGSWLYDPGYAKTGAGFLQALTTGIPGYPPTWQFYRNTLVSDVLFTVLFVVCFAARNARVRTSAPLPAATEGLAASR